MDRHHNSSLIYNMEQHDTGVDEAFLQELFDIADTEASTSLSTSVDVSSSSAEAYDEISYTAGPHGYSSSMSSYEALHSISSSDNSDDDDDEDHSPSSRKREMSSRPDRINKKQRLISLDGSSSAGIMDQHAVITPFHSPCSSVRTVHQEISMLEENGMAAPNPGVDSNMMLDPLFCLPSTHLPSSAQPRLPFIGNLEDPLSSSSLYYLPTTPSDQPDMSLSPPPQVQEDKVSSSSPSSLQAPCSSMNGFVNAYLVVDPNTNMVYFPKQVITYRRQGIQEQQESEDVIETSTFGPFLLPTFNPNVVQEFTNNVVSSYQQNNSENTPNANVMSKNDIINESPTVNHSQLDKTISLRSKKQSLHHRKKILSQEFLASSVTNNCHENAIKSIYPVVSNLPYNYPSKKSPMIQKKIGGGKKKQRSMKQQYIAPQQPSPFVSVPQHC